MKERPILFSAPMVRAILDGRKTQTRRSINPQPIWIAEPSVPFKTADADPNGIIKCPYGKPRDRLWVRETFFHDFEHNRYFYRADQDNDGSVPYLINGCGLGGGVGNASIEKWSLSIYMPRRASRILLEVINVRVERLQDISESDARDEGVRAINFGYGDCYELGFKQTWESINGSGSWDLNPWVWVVEFKKIHG